MANGTIYHQLALTRTSSGGINMMATTECINNNEKAVTNNKPSSNSSLKSKKKDRSSSNKSKSHKNKKIVKSLTTMEGNDQCIHPELLFGNNSRSSRCTYSADDFVLDVSSSSWNMLDLEDKISVETFMLPTRMSPTATSSTTGKKKTRKCCPTDALYCMSPPLTTSMPTEVDDDITAVTSPSVSTEGEINDEEPEQGRPEMKQQSSLSSLIRRHRRPRRVYRGEQNTGNTLPRKAKSLLSSATKQYKSHDQHTEDKKKNISWDHQQLQTKTQRSPRKTAITRFRGGAEIGLKHAPRKCQSL